MRQALHIFRKDVRCLTYEIVVTLAMVAAYVYFNLAQPSFFPSDFGIALLLPIAGWVLIARLIHAEALPGTRQFWLTRPYSRTSLLTAKILFLLVFINLPKLVADAMIVHRFGYSLSAALPGLLWSQVLLFGLFILPLAALATLTSSTAQLVFSTLFLLLVLFFGSGFEFGPMDWVVHSYTAAALALAAAVIVTLQYSLRRTALARFAGVVLWLVVITGGFFIPLSTVIGLQARLSKQRIDPAQIRVALDAERPSAMRVLDNGVPFTQIQMPLQVTDVPQAFAARIIGTSMRIEAADGTVWPSRVPQDSRFGIAETPAVTASMPRDSYLRLKDQPVTIRATAYVTLFGHRRTTLVAPSELTLIPGAGVCLMRVSFGPPALECRALFRTPSTLILLPNSFGGYPLSYSPFPAELGISPAGFFGFYNASLDTSQPVSMVTMEPLAYIQRDFEIANLRLRDYEKPPPQMRLMVR
jgi:hypothetical protein